MDLWIVVTAVITTLACTMIYGGIIGAVFLIKQKRLKSNPVDISIYELNEKGYQWRLEVGRFLVDPHRGRVLVTCTKWYWGGIKEYLGYHISVNDFTPSKYGNGRQFVEVAIKDGLVAPLRKIAKSNKKMTEDEIASLKLWTEKFVTTVKIDNNPETLSLTPIKGEQLRFALDGYKDAAELYNDKDKNLAATLLKYAIIGIVVLGIAFIVGFILMIVMGPDAAAKVATSHAQTVIQYVNQTVPPG